MSMFPDWIEARMVPDEAFAAAYDAVDPALRAVFKTGIARLYEWYTLAPDMERSETVRWRAGFASTRWRRPREYAVIFFDDTALSPVQLTALLAPAMAARNPHLLAVYLGSGDLPAPVLTAFELAGQEQVAVCTEDEAARLVDHLLATGKAGAAVTLGCGTAGRMALPVSARLGRWRACLGREAAVWMDTGDEFDLTLLAACHPDTRFEAWGANDEAPEGFEPVSGGFEALLRRAPEVAYVPGNRLEAAMSRVPLVFGPGQEGMWLWPDLNQQLFFHERIGWHGQPDE